MNDALPRLNAAIDYLKDSGQIHKQQDIADTLACRRLYPGDELSPGRAYVVDLPVGPVVKHLAPEGPDGLRCISENPRYPAYTVAVSDVRALYQVVALLRRF